MQEAINMSPSPSWEHQIVCDNLVSMIKGKSPCQPISNLSVKLEKNGNVMNEFIQPDVAVYCERPEKIIGGYKGRPLIVIEVVSPSTYKIDVTLKKICTAPTEWKNTGSLTHTTKRSVSAHSNMIDTPRRSSPAEKRSIL